jgi:hypothetical protein
VSKLLHCTGVGRVLKSTVSAIGLITRTASCQSCQFVLADGRGALLESLGEETVKAFDKVLKSPTAKLIEATKGIPIVGAAANFALADNVCERIKVVTTFGCELGAGALIVGGAASAGILSTAGLFAFAACATVGAGVEGACGEIAPKSWSMPSGDKAKHYFDFIDRKGTDNVCSVVCPAGASGGQQRRREALAAMTTLAANLTWPSSFVALATVDSGTGSERRVLLAQSKTRNAALALTLGANDTWSAQWQQCSDAGAAMSSQVRGACGTAAPQAFCPSSLPQAILVQVVSDALARVSGARNTSTPSDFVDVGDFELERPDNATIVLGNQSFPGAMHWRARVDVNASDNPNVTETQFSVLFQQAADGRPLALSIELNLEARFVMAFWAINSAVTASQLDTALTVPSCCNSSATANSTCATSTLDLAASLVQLLDGGKSALPLDAILPASLLAASTSVSSATQSPAVSSTTESLSSTIDVSQSTASSTSPSNGPVTTTTEGVASSALTVLASLQLTAVLLGAAIII